MKQSAHTKRTSLFADKTVVVTGSSRGIGRETARAFAEAGASVVLHGRNYAKLQEVAGMIRQVGAEVRIVTGDICDSATALALVQAADELGGCDVLVNNAGTSMRGAFSEIAPEVFDSVMRTNVVGAAIATRAFLDQLTRSSGSVVFVSSVAGLRGFPGVSIYSAAKMALTGLSQALRAEIGSSGVHTAIVYVGFTENDDDKEILSADGSPLRLKRAYDMTQREVAAAVLRAVRTRRNRTVLTRKGKLLSVLDRMLPRVVDSIVRRSGGRIHRMSK